jgi:hypothetical protein
MDKYFSLQLMMQKWNSTLFNVGASNNYLNFFNNSISFNSNYIMQNSIFDNNLNLFNMQNSIWGNPCEVFDNYNKTVNYATNSNNNVNSVQSAPPQKHCQSQ